MRGWSRLPCTASEEAGPAGPWPWTSSLQAVRPSASTEAAQPVGCYSSSPGKLTQASPQSPYTVSGGDVTSRSPEQECDGGIRCGGVPLGQEWTQ